MGIIVVDQGPELYWFVSNALLQDELPLKHVQTIPAAEKIIAQELPEIVILNGDDKTLIPEKFINKMRNHVFARNTLFIVVTSDLSVEFKKALLIAGAGQVLYRSRTAGPSPKFFSCLVKWFLNNQNPDPQIFDYKPSPFHAEMEFTSFGRIGWISQTHCLIETNVDLSPGQSIGIKNTLFDELEIKNVKLECVEKNNVGRYYQYSNSLLCKLSTKDPGKDQKSLKAWINDNASLTKPKSIKLVYFENDPDYRDEIRQMVKAGKGGYCARGYADLKNIEEILEYQLPQLILINRALIQKDKPLFEVIKAFVKKRFCYCVTYSDSELFAVEEFKKEYEFAMHAPNRIDLSLLESMILKLEQKLPENLKVDNKKMYFDKHSVNSRLSLHATGRLTELALSGVGIQLPFAISNFCACEISSNAFGVANLGRAQFFRSFINKASSESSKGKYHRLIFIGQTLKDNDLVRTAVDLISQFGFDRWINNEIKPEEIKSKKG